MDCQLFVPGNMGRADKAQNSEILTGVFLVIKVIEDNIKIWTLTPEIFFEIVTIRDLAEIG